MTAPRKTFLSELMAKAWFIYRNRTMPGCRVVTFADALRASWAWFKRQALAPLPYAAPLVLRSMVQSPIRRSLTPFSESGARRAGYVTSVLGA